MVELIIQAKDFSIDNIYCDTTGWHCLIAMANDTYYAHLSSAHTCFLHKLHECKIESVGWSPQTEHYYTREVLLGTSKGSILEI